MAFILQYLDMYMLPWLSLLYTLSTTTLSPTRSASRPCLPLLRGSILAVAGEAGGLSWISSPVAPTTALPDWMRRMEACRAASCLAREGRQQVQVMATR